LKYKGYGKYFGPVDTISGWWRDFMDLNGQAVYIKYDNDLKKYKMFQTGTFNGKITATSVPSLSHSVTDLTK